MTTEHDTEGGQPVTPEMFEEFAQKYAVATEHLLDTLYNLSDAYNADFLDAYYRLGEGMDAAGDLTGENGDSVARIRMARVVANGVRALLLATKQCWSDMEAAGFDPTQWLDGIGDGDDEPVIVVVDLTGPTGGGE